MNEITGHRKILSLYSLPARKEEKFSFLKYVGQYVRITDPDFGCGDVVVCFGFRLLYRPECAALDQH